MRRRPLFCKACGSKGDLNAPISYRGWCVDCAVKRIRESNVALQNREGAYYDRWLTGTAAGTAAYAKRLRRRKRAAEARRGEDTAGSVGSSAGEAQPAG